MKKGKFIVLEGADGSGKATQQKLLIKRIRKELKRKVYKIDFPQYEKSFFGNLAGRYLAGEFGSLHETNPYLASLTYAGDRWQASVKISKRLTRGEIVVANRYALSNMAHQTAKLPDSKRMAFLKFLEELEYGIYKIPKEDLNIFLNVPAKIAQTLVDGKTQRSYIKGKRDIHEGDLNHLKESIRMYKYLAKKYPNKITIVECNNAKGNLKSIIEIHELVWKVVKNKLLPYVEL